MPALDREWKRNSANCLRATRVPIHLDEPVREIDGLVIVDPIDSELDPVLPLPGLVMANQVGDYLRLFRARVLPGFLKILIRLAQIFGVKPLRDTAIGRARPVDLLPPGSRTPLRRVNSAGTAP
jgi:hypothetical protein